MSLGAWERSLCLSPASSFSPSFSFSASVHGLGSFPLHPVVVASPCKTSVILLAALSLMCKLRGIRNTGNADKGELIGLLLLFMALMLSGILRGGPRRSVCSQTQLDFPARQQPGEAIPGWVQGGSMALAGQGKEAGGTPASFLAVPSSSLAWEALSSESAWGTQTWGTAQLLSRTRLCRQMAALSLAGQVTWGREGTCLF